jgi:hypothetical protein
MNGKANCTFGGVGGGVLVVDLTLDDGKVWHFQGGFGYIGTPGVAYGIGLKADFPGLSHIDGDCAFEVLDGGMGPGGVQMTFFDLHGTIGTVYGYVFGGGAQFGIGGGKWTAVPAQVPVPA